MTDVTRSAARVGLAAVFGHVEVARRRVVAEDVHYARARRPEQGWQTLAHQLGVNVLDLRRACEGPLEIDASATGRAQLFPHSPEAACLAAIGEGWRNVPELAAALGRDQGDAKDLTKRLRAKDLIAWVSGVGFDLTATGARELARLAGPRGRP